MAEMSGGSIGQDPGRIITFYSFKGGTGRSMALANIACALAQGLVTDKERRSSHNNRVLAIDWDLEAPGLHRYFAPYLPAERGGDYDSYVRNHPGLIDLFVDIDAATQRFSSRGGDEDADAVKSLLNGLNITRKFIVPTSIRNLSFMKAGRIDQGYPGRVNDFRWDIIYERMPSLITGLARYLSHHYSYVLIDSRTGITDTSGICTMLMPELLVLVFTPNLQSLGGVIDLIREATDYRKVSPDFRPLAIFPLPSRIESAKPKLLEQWRKGSKAENFRGYQDQFEEAFKVSYNLDKCDLTGYFDEIQIQHVPDYAYGEQIAVAVEGTDSRLSLRRSYESFTSRLISLPSPWTDPRAAAVEAQILQLVKQSVSALSQGDKQRARRHLATAVDAYLESDHLSIPELVDSLHDLGTRYLTDGDLDEAETVFHEAVQVAERGFGSADLRVADALERLGDVLSAAGKAQEALAITRKALELRKEVLGPKHPSVADANDKVGTLLASLGKFEESRLRFIESLEARREKFGPNDPILAASLERLAGTAMAMGNMREAATYLNEALRIAANESPATRARILGSLGSVSLRERDLGAAEGFYRQAIDTLGSTVEDDEAPAIAAIFDGMAEVAIANGDFDDAQSYYERAQLARESALGPSHPETLRSIVNLGDLAAAQGNWERATIQYRRATSLAERTVGAAHPLVGEVYSKLGKLAQQRGEYAEATRNFRRALGIFDQLGNEAEIAATYRNLGILAQVRGDYDEAASNYQHALTITERLGDEAGLARVYHQLGILAQDRGDYDEADSNYKHALLVRERLGNQAEIAATYGDLGILARYRRRFDEAARHFQHAKDIFEKLGDLAGVAGVYRQMGILALEREDHDEAVRNFERAFAIFERLGDHRGQAIAYNNLGIVALDRQNYEEATRNFRRAQEIFERLGDQAGLARAYYYLGFATRELGDHEKAADNLQRAVAIFERLGDRAGLAASYTQRGILEAERGSPADEIASWHLRAFLIKFSLQDPDAVIDLRRLAAYRRELGPEAFTSLLTSDIDDAASVQRIVSLVDEMDAHDSGTA